MNSGKSETGPSGESETRELANDAPLAFPEWSGVLAGVNWPEDIKKRRQLAIMRLLKFCKLERRPVSVTLIKSYLDGLEGQSNLWPETKEALRWFVVEARRRTGDGRAEGRRDRKAETVRLKAEDGRPEGRSAGRNAYVARDDLGGPDWERALVSTLRVQGKLWRTEQTYRGWAWRFADFIRPMSPEGAGTVEVKAFLTDLAVRQRVGQSTQKQALNALVYLLREGLKRELGDFSDFARAASNRRVPVVLSRDEITRLMDKLEGTSRLMAFLGYGAGLRLMELLRLRVKDVDLERCQVAVRGGKGDKDRVSVLSRRLVEPLRVHRERLRGLWEQDRAAGLPGVWLPEALERKLGRAGETWEWSRT